MAQPLLFPFGVIQPDQILRQYSDWVYFILVMVLFIAIAGVTLRNHFQQPYVRSLIPAVGIMLAVGTFMAKKWLVVVFEAWGILGLILLGFIALFVPFALARGFGMPGLRAFYCVYSLAYIVSWVKFPQLYYALAEANLGLVNLGLLVLFVFSVYKAIWYKASEKSLVSRFLHQDNPRPLPTADNNDKPELRRQEAEVKNQAADVGRRELKTVEDMAALLHDIQQTIAQYPNGLPKPDRERVVKDIKNIQKRRDLLRQELARVRKQAQKLGRADADKVRDLQEKLNKASGQERESIAVELRAEEEKLVLERALMDLESKMEGLIKAFTGHLDTGISQLGSGAVAQAQQALSQGQQVLQEIVNALSEIKVLDEKLLSIMDQQERRA